MKQTNRKMMQELETAIQELKTIHKNRQETIKTLEKEMKKAYSAQEEGKNPNAAGFFI